jgi:hypothetical protein
MNVTGELHDADRGATRHPDPAPRRTALAASSCKAMTTSVARSAGIPAWAAQACADARSADKEVPSNH